MLAVRHPRELVKLRWGLIPVWAKDAKIAYSTINARADTVATKPAFRAAYKKRRCLILAEGYFEWLKVGKAKQPLLYEVDGGSRLHLPDSGNGGAGPTAIAQDFRTPAGGDYAAVAGA